MSLLGSSRSHVTAARDYLVLTRWPGLGRVLDAGSVTESKCERYTSCGAACKRFTINQSITSSHTLSPSLLLSYWRHPLLLASSGMMSLMVACPTYAIYGLHSKQLKAWIKLCIRYWRHRSLMIYRGCCWDVQDYQIIDACSDYDPRGNHHSSIS